MYASLNDTPNFYDDGLDAIVITDNFQGIRGGRTLDVTGFAPSVIRKGHVIIRQTSTGNYKPMPVTGVSSIASLGTASAGAGYVNAGTYAGVALTGGSGAGATADISVADGRVVAIKMVNKGSGYASGDILSAAAANIGTGGSGFSVPVVSINEAAAYAALPAGHTYEGVLMASITKAKPFAGIMVRGNVNPVAAPYDMPTIAGALKTAVPGITTYAD